MDLESVNCPDLYWPVYKGASFNLWTPETGITYAWADPKPVLDFLQSKRKRAGRNRRSVHSEFSDDFLLDPLTLPCHHPRVAFRDQQGRACRRTVITCLLPPKIFLTNTSPYFLWAVGDEKDQAFLLGVLSSIPLDWYARRFVELHVNYFILNSFPIPRPTRDNLWWKRVVQLAGRLACPDHRFTHWADKVGVTCGPLVEADKQNNIEELDAVVAHLYGLSEDQLIHIFETFHDGWDYESHLSGVIHHYNNWRT